MLLAHSFLQFTLGNVITMLVFVGGGVVGYFRLRGLKNEELEKVATFWRAQAETLTETVDEHRARVAEVERERDEQRVLKHELKAQLAAEKLKRDLTVVLAQMTSMQQAVLDRIETSERTSLAFAASAEERMQERFERWEVHQEMISETLKGLLHGVGDLNKKIKP